MMTLSLSLSRWKSQIEYRNILWAILIENCSIKIMPACHYSENFVVVRCRLIVVVVVFIAINHCNMFARLSFIIVNIVCTWCDGERERGKRLRRQAQIIMCGGLASAWRFQYSPCVTHTSKLLHLISGGCCTREVEMKIKTFQSSPLIIA